MPKTKYTLEELIKQCDDTAPAAKESSEWLSPDEKAELHQFLLLSDDSYIKEISAQCEEDIDKALNTFFTLLDAYYEKCNEAKE